MALVSAIAARSVTKVPRVLFVTLSFCAKFLKDSEYTIIIRAKGVLSIDLRRPAYLALMEFPGTADESRESRESLE